MTRHGKERCPLDLRERQIDASVVEVAGVARARLVEEFARELHDYWRAPRRRSVGSFEPRVTDDRADWQLGIANTTFNDLPGP